MARITHWLPALILFALPIASAVLGSVWIAAGFGLALVAASAFWRRNIVRETIRHVCAWGRPPETDQSATIPLLAQASNSPKSPEAVRVDRKA